jgi:hypothetical protein
VERVLSAKFLNYLRERRPRVKRLIALLVLALFVTGTAGLALAQSQSAPAPKTDEKKMDKAGEKKMTSKNASGTVKSAAAESVVVAGKDKGKETEWTFAVDAKTKIRKAGKDITPADLKPGDSVQVRYMDHEGKAVAQAITVRGGGMAKDDKKAPSEGATKPAEKK